MDICVGEEGRDPTGARAGSEHAQPQRPIPRDAATPGPEGSRAEHGVFALMRREACFSREGALGSNMSQNHFISKRFLL